MDFDDRDPRVGRTRQHVLGVVRELLSERTGMPTFTQVADRANVARQTLYKHWGTIERLVAASIVVGRIGSSRDYDDLDLRGRAELFFSRFVQEVDPGLAYALAILIATAAYDQDSRDVYASLDGAFYDMFCRIVAPLSHDDALQVVTPVMFLAMAGSTASPDLIDSLVGHTIELAERRLSEPQSVG